MQAVNLNVSQSMSRYISFLIYKEQGFFKALSKQSSNGNRFPVFDGVKSILVFALLPKVLHNSVIFFFHVGDMMMATLHVRYDLIFLYQLNKQSATFF